VLEEKLYGIDDPMSPTRSRFMSIHIRRKLLEPELPSRNHTVRGVGYLLGESRAMKLPGVRSLQLRLALSLPPSIWTATAMP